MAWTSMNFLNKIYVFDIDSLSITLFYVFDFVLNLSSALIHFLSKINDLWYSESINTIPSFPSKQSSNRNSFGFSVDNVVQNNANVRVTFLIAYSQCFIKSFLFSY